MGFGWVMSLWGISAPADLIHVGGQEIHFSFVDGFPRGAGDRNKKSVKITVWLALALFLNSHHHCTCWEPREALLFKLFILTN